ncbi:MAG: hypothetical protein PHF00_10395 [Elusimicrobia bacterium]|nr:hypothetical protein [Elusimicrobiota bacterium]
MAERSSSNIAVLAVAMIVVSAVGAGLYHLLAGKQPAPKIAAFDIQQVNAPPPDSQAEPQASAPADSTNLFAENKPAPAAPAAAPESDRERRFIAKYDGLIRKYQQRLHTIVMRYQKKHPVCKEVDATFASMDRYMAIKKRYESDRNFYRWARDTAALPEVRAAVSKYLRRPEAWKVAVDMSMEAVKEPLPAPIYQEFVHGLATDPAMLDFSEFLAGGIRNNLGVAIPALVGKDITALQPMMRDLTLLDKKTR